MIRADHQENGTSFCRADLREIFRRHAEATLASLFQERAVPPDHHTQLLSLALDEAVKQFPKWITQVALICHVSAQYRNDVYSYLASMVGDSQTADDLTQETFVKVMIAVRKGDRVPPASRTLAWLFMIGTNLVRDTARKRKSLKECGLDGVDDAGLATSDAGLDARLDLREALDKVKRCCGARMAQLLELVKEGFSKHEIAAKQAISGRTVERRLQDLASALGRVAGR